VAEKEKKTLKSVNLSFRAVDESEAAKEAGTQRDGTRRRTLESLKKVMFLRSFILNDTTELNF